MSRPRLGIGMNPGRVKIVEERQVKRHNRRWDAHEKDDLFNWILEHGDSDYSYQQWYNNTGRSPRGADRKIDQITYLKEKASLVLSYRPTEIRKVRGNAEVSGVERRILIKHRKDGVPLENTSWITQRTLFWLVDWYKNNP